MRCSTVLLPERKEDSALIYIIFHSSLKKDSSNVVFITSKWNFRSSVYANI